MSLPYPCCCNRCETCDALFALNWVIGINCPTYAYQLGLTAGENADNQAYVDAIKTAFSNITITWVNTTYAGGFIAKVCKAVHATTYTLHAHDPFTGVNKYSFTVKDTTLTFGAAWKDTATGVNRRCRPSWFFILGATYVVGGVDYSGLITSNSGAGGLFGPITINADGYYTPFSGSNSNMVNTPSNCLNPKDNAGINVSIRGQSPIHYAYYAGTTTPSGVSTTILNPPASGFYYNNAVGVPLPPPVCP